MHRRNSMSSDSSRDGSSGSIAPAKRPSGRGRRSLLLQRRTTYEARKLEAAALRIEVDTLRARIAQLHLDRESIDDRRRRNEELRSLVEHQQLQVASMHSMLGRFVTSHGHLPFHSAIHLPCDLSARRAVLAAVRDDKLTHATNFILARQRALGDHRESRQIDEFVDENSGDHVSMHCEVTHFRGVPSVRAVFNALLQYMQYYEMNLAEKTGVMTMSDSGDWDDHQFFQSRYLSLLSESTVVESNGVAFARFCSRDGATDQSFGPYGIVVGDFVERDDLYPYQPLTRARRDAAAVVMVTEHKTPGASAGQVDVTMTRWALVRIRGSPIQRSPELEELKRRGSTSWCDVMVTSMRETLGISYFSDENSPNQLDSSSSSESVDSDKDMGARE